MPDRSNSMATSINTFRLLDLPPELRLIVYRQVLTIPWEHPAFPEDCSFQLNQYTKVNVEDANSSGLPISMYALSKFTVRPKSCYTTGALASVRPMRCLGCVQSI